MAAAGPDRLAGVRVIGVDEHRWAPRRRGTEGFVTVIIDLTPVLDGAGRARLLDMVAGRSAAALTRWLANQPPAFRDQVEVVAMDGSAATRPPPPSAARGHHGDGTPFMPRSGLCRCRVGWGWSRR